MSLKKDATKINNKIKVVEIDSDNDNIKEDVNKDIKPKNKGGRLKKSDKYKEERLDIVNKINNILGVTETNKKFYTYDLDKDEAKQKEIMKLKDDVEKYFASKQNALFSKDKHQRDYLLLIRLVYKDMKIKMSHITTTITRDDKKVQSGGYLLENDE
jgi:hypothetical protein